MDEDLTSAAPEEPTDGEFDEVLDVDASDPVEAVAAAAGGRADYRGDAKSLESLLLGGERTLKRRDVAQGVGLSLFSARKLWRALGMPNFTDDDLAFTSEDLEHLKIMPALVRDGVLTEDAAISVTRAIGQMTDRMVVWQVEALVEDMVATQGISDAEARVRLVDELPRLIEPLEEMLVYSWRRQLSAGVQRLAVRAKEGLEASEEGRKGTEDDAPLPLARAVGFADLVSYTSLSRRMNEKTLARLVQTFESICAEVISVGGGRLVKTVGDEVLYIAETPTAGAEIALALSREIAADERLPEGRVAMVWGRVLSRLGDIYGPTVNLAARLTAIADPGQVLVDELTAGVLGSDPRFVFEGLEAQNVRGFGEIRPVVLRRGEGTGIVLD
ncbi:adenylate/guanylate cyclase domain-containing protein [Sinomonas albida]|uniref:adenylate/guanylate cyclase domain-containing protein n=1 Tax=Sinomonas albida TaxID=369942 RepID=UPI001F157E04|nr:adenylate/guanylate cyclase domain-containing protein [Sinomonas albida]